MVGTGVHLTCMLAQGIGNWYNQERINSSLSYVPRAECKKRIIVV